MNNYQLDMEGYARLARQVAAESCVLLKNDKHCLPLQAGAKVAVFGRSMLNYFKSGLGSGGLVNTAYVVGILDALRNEASIEVNEDLINCYEHWVEDHPYDHGSGWGQVPWSQEEMPLTDQLLEETRQQSDVAIVIIGRTAGEDQDNHDDEGAYQLSSVELQMIESVTKTFDKTLVLLNVGNIIDMKWVKTYKPEAVMYVWQGGQEGGNGVLDVLTGRVNPSGKLTDTIANDIADFPSSANFGDPDLNYYVEDIYVGYRYFETFDQGSVAYPFGYGLSYTDFTIEGKVLEHKGRRVAIEASVENTGNADGQEVLQLYCEAPQGLLGKAKRVLVDFEKTSLLASGASAQVAFLVDLSKLASFDDVGSTGYANAYLLEAGVYNFYLGSDVRSAKFIGNITMEFDLVEQLSEAYAPKKNFERLVAKTTAEGEVTLGRGQVPLRKIDLEARVLSNRQQVASYTGDQGIRLADVVDDRASLDDFIAQISDEELACLFRGEGMCSPKVTPGTAGAFGGVTEALRSYGIPIACCADGPSGIRMDCGTLAFSLPNGTAVGATFNMGLIEDLFNYLGLEVRRNKIDTILGPGINIHRHPLNGRNFEYISEDPYLSGKMAIAQLRGLAKAGVTGTLKHFVANNQEVGRHTADMVISQRALREIYLKAFEMAVKEGDAYAIMTSYGPVNHLWTAGSYDLNTSILRQEWGFDGLVMTDWWADANFDDEPSIKGNVAAMLRAQNDLFMVTNDALSNSANDNTMAMLEQGYITRYELHRSAKNILKFIMRSPVMLHAMNRISQEELDGLNKGDLSDDASHSKHAFRILTTDYAIDASDFNTDKSNYEVFTVSFRNYGHYKLIFKMKSEVTELAQLPITIYLDGVMASMISVQGSNGQWVETEGELGNISGSHHYVKLYFGQSGLDIESIRFVRVD